MEFKEYIKGKKVIRATETAFKAIYEAQGFSPVSGGNANGRAKDDDKGGSGGTDNGESASAGKSKKPKP